MDATVATVLLGTVVMGVAMAAMAVGAMVAGKELKGSCGGTGGKDCVCSIEEQRACRAEKLLEQREA